MIWIALVFSSLFSVCGQLCQKQATRPVSVRARKHYITQWIRFALTGLGLIILLQLVVLQNIPVGVAYPILSFSFVWVTLAAWKIWREPIIVRHWLGAGLIIVGIFILGSAV